ncbi:MAG: thiamine phosphate synthase [Magnetococcus sp. DMHC-8]
MKPPVPRLLLITDSALCADLPRAVADTLAGGVRHVLLREKQMPAGPLTRLAHTLLTLTTAHGAHLLLHDRVDVALDVGAAGVHLPACGLATSAARRLLPHALLGRSCHTVAEAVQACQDGADYVTLSPLFATRSHPEATPLGVTRFAAMRSQVPGPVLALGGIRPDNAVDALRTGADGLALMRGILNAPRPRQAAEELLSQIFRELPMHG